MSQQMLNVMRREAESAVNRVALPKMGVVTGYDAGHYACKVRLQPEDTETGWLPIATTWSGSGWGDYNPPSPGDVVEVHFQEGGKEAGYVSQRFYSTVTRPLAVPSGESWRVHQSGSCLKFKAGGVVEIVAATRINSTAPLWHHTGDIVASGDISDRDGLYGTVGYLRTAYDLHRHLNTLAGAGTSGLTDHPV